MVYVAVGVLIGAAGFIAIYEPDPPETVVFETVYAKGTNSVPLLIELLQRRDSTLKKKLIEWSEIHPRWGLHLRSASENHFLAARGFKILGTNAAFAALELIRTCRANFSEPGVTEYVRQILDELGPESLSPLYASLQTERIADVEFRCWEIYSIITIETNSDKLVTLLVQSLGDTNANVRQFAATGARVMKVSEGMNLAIPALQIAAADSNQLVSYNAAIALKRLETNARDQGKK